MPSMVIVTASTPTGLGEIVEDRVRWALAHLTDAAILSALDERLSIDTNTIDYHQAEAAVLLAAALGDAGASQRWRTILERREAQRRAPANPPFPLDIPPPPHLQAMREWPSS
jgi:hypothetical protein